MGFVDRVKQRAAQRGRLFNVVTHPAPEADVIEADWLIRVEIGDERI